MKGDLTTGSPARKLFAFTAPTLVGVLFQQLYSIVDSIIIGRFVSLDALAAVSASYPVTALFIGMATGGSAGATILVSFHFGSKQMDEMMTSVRTCLISFGSFALTLMLGGLLLDRPVLTALQTPAEIFVPARQYLDIFLLGLPFLFLYNAVNASFQAIGNSRTPLALLIFSSGLNVVLDLWWVAGLGWGVIGAAAATLLSQALACITALCLLHRQLRSWRELGQWFRARTLRSLIHYAVPGMLQQSVVAVGQLFMQSRINSFGTAVVAGHAAAFKINTIVLAVMNAQSSALSAFTSQNLGAGKKDRITRGFRAALGASLALCGAISACAFFFSGSFVGIFLEKPVNREALDTGIRFLHIVSPFYLLLGVKMCADGLLKGLGDMKTFTISTLCDLCVRVGTAFLLSSTIGYTAVCLGYPFGWIVGITLTCLGLFRARRHPPVTAST